MYISIFELFKIGIGPSSSHTVGPINASNKFIEYVKINDLKLKTSNPGLRIIKTPIKPKKIANQIFLSTNSFRNIIDKNTTIIGDNAATLCTSPKGKYLKEVTKNAVSKIEERDLKSCIFKFLVFQTC